MWKKTFTCLIQKHMDFLTELSRSIKKHFQIILTIWWEKLKWEIIGSNYNWFFTLSLFDFYSNYVKKIFVKFIYLKTLNGPISSCLFFVELLVCKRQSAGIFFGQNGQDYGIKHFLLFSKSINFFLPFDYLLKQAK